MRLGDIMSEKVDSVTPSDAIDLAAELMKRQQIHHIVVIDGDDVVGIVSARDLSARRPLGGRLVREFMSAPVTTASPHTTVRQAANLLRGQGIGCLPIVSGGKLVGIVTVSDLLDLIGSGAEHLPSASRHWEEKHRGHRRARYVPGR
jgi:acetoin utilization protein AcuB